MNKVTSINNLSLLKTQIINDISAKISELLSNNMHVLFLLSGGSATEIGLSVLHRIANVANESLSVSLVDERWDPNFNHSESNWNLIKNSEIYKKLIERNVEFYEILQGTEIDNETKMFNDYLNDKLEQVTQVVGLFGMGEDGHTAGIFPCDLLTYINTYASEKLVISHSLSPKSTPTRMTVSPKMINLINYKYLFAVGEPKKEKLNNLIQNDSNLKINDIAKQPSLLISNNTLIYTDQKI